MGLSYEDADIRPVLSMNPMGQLDIRLGTTSKLEVTGLFDSEKGYVRDGNVSVRILSRSGIEIDYGVMTLAYVDGTKGNYSAEISSLFNPDPGSYKLEIKIRSGVKILTKMLSVSVLRPSL